MMGKRFHVLLYHLHRTSEKVGYAVVIVDIQVNIANIQHQHVEKVGLLVEMEHANVTLIMLEIVVNTQEQ